MRTVTVLLTKYSDLMSNIMYHISGRGYTHASLALGEDENIYYSFNYGGFCVETLEKHRNRGVKESLRYQLKVSEGAYQKLKERLESFQRNSSDL